MSYLIDSDWVIDYLRGVQTAVAFLHAHARDNLAISLMTYGEVYEGIYYGPSRRVSEEGFRRLLAGVAVLPLNRQIMRRFALIRGNLRNRGELIGDPDIMIAATGLHHNLTLVTRNVRHFERIAGLPLYQ
jgi:predicted nucleic acid-binding protein